MSFQNVKSANIMVRDTKVKDILIIFDYKLHSALLQNNLHFTIF